MWALRRPKVDNNDFAAVVAEFMPIPLQVRELKVRRQFVQLHNGIIVSKVPEGPNGQKESDWHVCAFGASGKILS
jgi:hypothetical protein